MDEINENLDEDEIDKLVIEQADNDDAWEEPIHIHRESRQL